MLVLEKLWKFSTNFRCNLLEIRVKFKIFQFQWFLQLKTDLKIVQNIIQTCLNDLFYFLNLIILNQKPEICMMNKNILHFAREFISILSCCRHNKPNVISRLNK